MFLNVNKHCLPKQMAVSAISLFLNYRSHVWKASKTVYKNVCYTQRRSIASSIRLFSGDYEWQDPKSAEDVISVTYIDKNGKETVIKGKIGDNLMYLAHRHEIEMEGACEASLACTTCHVYVHNDFYDKLPLPEEKEDDLLDMAPFLKQNSRLGCQIILTKALDGIQVQLPKATRNFYVDGHKPKPH